MAVEYEPNLGQPQPEVQTVPSQPELPADLEQGTGAQVVSDQPQQLNDPQDDTQVIAQPVPAPPEPTGPSITIPQVFSSEEQIEQYTHGAATDAVTWEATTLMRKIHMAVRRGWRVIFGFNKQQ